MRQTLAQIRDATGIKPCFGYQKGLWIRLPSSIDWAGQMTMKEMCYYKMTVTVELCPYNWTFPRPQFTWYLAMPWPDVLKKVKWYYEQGADAVELRMITREQFENSPNDPSAFDLIGSRG